MAGTEEPLSTLGALVRGEAHLSELPHAGIISESLPALAAGLYPEMRKLIGYMAVVTFNCRRGERKTRLGRANMAATNPEIVFYAGRPPEYSQSQRIYHTALLESLLASLDGDMEALEKSSLSNFPAFQVALFNKVVASARWRGGSAFSKLPQSSLTIICSASVAHRSPVFAR